MNSTSILLPPATIGVVGGGQLGQMIGQAAVSLGFRIITLDPTPGCPAASVSTKQIVADYDDADAIRELAQMCDVVTYEFENVSAETLEQAAEYTRLPQGTRALTICQNRLAEKKFLTEIGVPIADYRPVIDLEADITAFGAPAVLKTTEGGYDGKGQVVIRDNDDWAAGSELALNAPTVLERLIDFEVEISVIVAGNPSGEYVAFPPTLNEHRNGILHRTFAPAEVADSVVERAIEIALHIASNIELAGVMGVEMFVRPDGEILVNELAPRPHNSGHYTIEGCDVSQFEAHVRGICSWPLTRPKLLGRTVMENVLGEDLEAALASIAFHPEWHYHFYGKEKAAVGRKMGHVTYFV